MSQCRKLSTGYDKVESYHFRVRISVLSFLQDVVLLHTALDSQRGVLFHRRGWCVLVWGWHSVEGASGKRYYGISKSHPT